MTQPEVHGLRWTFEASVNQAGISAGAFLNPSIKPLPIVTVVGYSNSGKTRCLTGLVACLTQRTFRVATVKHCHRGFHLDIEEKDSWKHMQAGAVTTVLSSGQQVGVISQTRASLPLGELCRRFIHEVDIVLAEGFSWEPFPRILVVSQERLAEERIPLDEHLIALVSDARVDCSIPQFPFDRMDELTQLLEKQFQLIPG